MVNVNTCKNSDSIRVRVRLNVCDEDLEAKSLREHKTNDYKNYSEKNLVLSFVVFRQNFLKN